MRPLSSIGRGRLLNRPVPQGLCEGFGGDGTCGLGRNRYQWTYKNALVKREESPRCGKSLTACSSANLLTIPKF